MASISNDPGGLRRILFVAPDGKRKSIRLGKVSYRSADAVRFRVEELLASKLTGHAIDSDTARWIADLEPNLASKLSRVGLIESSGTSKKATLGPFLTTFLESRNDLKPATKVVHGQVIRNLTDFFGETRDVRSVSPGDADDFKQWLVGQKLASTTIHKRL